MVAEHVRKVIAVIEEKRRLRVSTTPKSSASDGGNVTHVFVASNSPAFVDELRQTMKPRSAGVQSVKIITLSEYFANAADEAAVRQAYWPEQARRPGGIGGTFTTTERAVLDITVMSMAEGMVLNKYSTFSQSAIDVRVQRHMMDEERSGGATVLRFDVENDPTVFWW
jgi:hypothetical protein